LARFKRKSLLKRTFLRAIKFCAALLLIFGVLSGAEVLLLRSIDPPFTTFMGWKWIESRVCTLPDEEPYRLPDLQWRTLKHISPHLIKAVLAAEDQRFLSHRGFDFVEMQDALRDIQVSGRIRGASTITMQVARTVFLWPSRTWLRKLLEAYYTVVIEILWSKKRIMEVYLNTVDWGNDLVGAEAAARMYFHKGAGGVTPPEAALMAAVLPNPHAWSPIHPSEYVKERQRRIMKDMEKVPSFQILH
jgi:monofunctional biosynthetic peptidoglycan transglycosylase